MPSHLNSLIFKSPDNCVIVICLFPGMNLSNSSVKIKFPASIPSSVLWCHCGAGAGKWCLTWQIYLHLLGPDHFSFQEGQHSQHPSPMCSHSQLLLIPPCSSSFAECCSWEAAPLLSKEGQSITNRPVGLSWKKKKQTTKTPKKQTKHHTQSILNNQSQCSFMFSHLTKTQATC